MTKKLITFFATGVILGSIATALIIENVDNDSPADHLVRLKAKCSAFEKQIETDRFTATSWDWDSYIRCKGDIAVLETKSNIERK